MTQEDDLQKDDGQVDYGVVLLVELKELAYLIKRHSECLHLHENECPEVPQSLEQVQHTEHCDHIRDALLLGHFPEDLAPRFDQIPALEVGRVQLDSEIGHKNRRGCQPYRLNLRVWGDLIRHLEGDHEHVCDDDCNKHQIPQQIQLVE